MSGQRNLKMFVTPLLHYDANSHIPPFYVSLSPSHFSDPVLLIMTTGVFRQHPLVHRSTSEQL
jgi:hypothetical protein